jgi:microcystin-dependent protein
MSEPFIGQVIMFAGNFAPRGWAFCDGQLLAISQHPSLFSILGTTYGGDGRTTFALPDLRGRVPTHEGTGPGLQPIALGQRSGQNNTSLTVSQLPPHNHLVQCSSDDGESDECPDAFLAKAADGESIYTSSSDGSKMNSSMITSTGAGTPFSVMQPHLGINFIIALEGRLPDRSEH